jgi:hypothetical protein
MNRPSAENSTIAASAARISQVVSHRCSEGVPRNWPPSNGSSMSIITTSLHPFLTKALVCFTNRLFRESYYASAGTKGWGIKARAVTRGLARRAPEVVGRIGVDEKAIAKRHRYLTIVADQVGRAWVLKERFRTFWEYRYLGAARTSYLRHHLTNAGLEGVNAVIQWVKKTARGFRNAEHFKTAIYFHCGGLDLYPHEGR